MPQGTKEKTYSELLKDPRWQKKRLKVLERDKFECVTCGDSESELHVHHGYYEFGMMPWDYHNDSLHTLCDDCHAMTKKFMTRVRKNLKSIDPEEWELVDRYVLKIVKNSNKKG